ncbi:TraR/DksA C4-type zinc finger protein [Sphingomonas trueperi]
MECADPIPARRREAMPWVTRCVSCQEITDQRDRRRR